MPTPVEIWPCSLEPPKPRGATRPPGRGGMPWYVRVTPPDAVGRGSGQAYDLRAAQRLSANPVLQILFRLPGLKKRPPGLSARGIDHGGSYRVVPPRRS